MDNKMLLGVICVIASIICIILAFIFKDKGTNIFYGLGTISIGLMIIAGLVISTTHECKTAGGFFFTSNKSKIKKYWEGVVWFSNKIETPINSDYIASKIPEFIEADLNYLKHNDMKSLEDIHSDTKQKIINLLQRGNENMTNNAYAIIDRIVNEYKNALSAK